MAHRVPIDGTDVPIVKLDLGTVEIKLQCLDFLPQVVAEKRCVLPIEIIQDQLTLAMADTADDEIVHEIEFSSGLSVKRAFVPFADLDALIREAYAKKHQGDRNFQPQIKKKRRSEPAPKPSAKKKIILDADDEAAQKAEAEALAAAAPREPARVLLLDQPGGDRELLAESLLLTGAIVLSEDHAIRGLVVARDAKPDVVIVDWAMTGMAGMEVANCLRQDPRFGKPAVLLTGAMEQSREERSALKKAYGISGYFKRPYDLGEIYRAIVQLTAEKKRARESIDASDGSDVAPKGPHEARIKQLLDRSANAHRQGEQAVSIELLRQAIKLDPIDYKIRYNLSLVLARNEEDEEALSHLAVCAMMRPDHFDAQKTRALLLDRLKRRDEAAGAFEIAIALAPNPDIAAPLRARLAQLRATHSS